MSIAPGRTRVWMGIVLAIAAHTAGAAPLGEVASGCVGVDDSAGSAHVAVAGAPVFPPPQLEIRSGFAPTVFPSAGRNYLVYELQLQNHSEAAVRIGGITLLDAEAAPAAPILELDAAQLPALLRAVGPDHAEAAPGDGYLLGGGRSATAYLCLAFDEGVHVPRRLHHRVAVDDGAVDGPVIGTAHTRLRVLGAPVDGSDWVAADGPSNVSHHRLGLWISDGAARISRRYAIDWKRLLDGASFAGDARDVHAYHAYGRPVFAVADGVVVASHDGLPDNVPRTSAGFSTAVPMTLETVAGNRIVLDIGGGQFAYYAHLQAGSLTVKPGDRVRQGQMLARIGNSGDAREPHLHFQLADGPDILAAEGLPYLIDRYTVVDGETRTPRRRELPLRGMMIDFAAAKPR